ncbi:ABC transporter permease [Corynebacterium sp. H128]|uniref:ABC transporter permease n=1 Tax=Corynebacterium sp. H128 TaxID=3133427 RepID=UPI00309CFA8D
MIRLAIAQLRRRGWRYLSLFFAVFAAVALTVGTAAIVESLQATVNGMFDKPYKGVNTVAQVRSSDKAAVDEALAQIPGEYAFDQQFSVSVKQEGSLYQSTYVRSIADGSLQWRDIVEGRLPVGPGEIAVVDNTALGSTLQLKTPGSDELKTVTVVGRTEQSAQEQLGGATALFVDATVARNWAGNSVSGELRAAEATTQQLKTLPKSVVSEVADAQAHTAQLAGKYLSGRDQYFLLLTAFMIIVAVVAMLVIFSSYSVIAAERQREYALLRAVGASATQLQSSAMVESLILGVVAGAAGIPAGLWAAGWAGVNAEKIGVKVPLVDVSLAPTWLAAIFVVALVVCVVSAVPAARGSARRPLVDSLTASAPKQSILGVLVAPLLGCGLLGAGGWGLTRVSGYAGRRALVLAIGSSGLIVLGTALVLAVVLPWLIFQLSRLFAFAPTLHLGMAFVGRQRLRAGSLVAIVLAGTALVAAVLNGQQQIEGYLLGKATNKGAVDVMVRAMDGTAEQPLIDALAATPGVVSALSPVALPVSAGGASDNVLALSATEGASVLRGPVTGAGPGELVLGANSPLRNTLSDGQRAQIAIRGQTHDLSVRYSSGLESFVDPVVTPEVPAIVRPGVDTRLPNPAVLIRVTGSHAQPADSPVVSELRTAAANAGEEVTFQEAFSARQDIAAMAARVLTLSTLMSVAAMLIAGVGALNTVTLAIRERAKDQTLLRAIGYGVLRKWITQAVEVIAVVIPALFVGWACGSALGLQIADVLTHQ